MKKINIKINNIKLTIISLIFITLIPLSILRIYQFNNNIQEDIETEVYSNIESAELINVAFMSFLDKTWSNQQLIGKAIVANKTLDINFIENFFGQIDKMEIPYVLDRFWLDNTGKVVYSTNENYIDLNLSRENYIKDILDGKDSVVGNLTLDKDTNMFIFPVVRAIKVDNILKGIVLTNIECRAVEGILNLQENAEVSKRRITIVDRDTNMIYSNELDNNMNFEERNLIAKEPDNIKVNGLLRISEGYRIPLTNEYSTGISYEMKNIGWKTIVSSSIANTIHNTKKEAQQSIIIFTIVYILAFIVAFFLSRDFTKFSNKMKFITNEIKKENKLNELEDYKYNSLEDLGKTFDNMISVLRQQIQQNQNNIIDGEEHLTMLFHEFKTPLNVIISCIQALENTEGLNSMEFEKIFNKYTKIQKQNSYRILRLINNYIDMSKIESNGWATDIRNTNIVWVIEDITLSIVEYGHINDIDIVFDTDVEECIIAVDINMIERIMLNLISNAIKFTNEMGLIEVNIETGDDFVSISVKDNGIGIPKDKLNNIFERFVQVENSFRRGPSGSGIGLYLVKTLVDFHNGIITVESEVGVGTKFTIKIPNRTIGDSFVSEENINLNGEKIIIELADISN